MTRRFLVAIALASGAFTPALNLSSAACAAPSARAALVVDTGSDVYRYCVALPDDDVSGVELITLASEQHGLDYKLGFGGEAVCMLAGVGPTGDDCFEDYPDFWGYWRGDDSGGWSWSGTGAGSATVGDGDVEGWAWGSGDDGSSHQRPPPTKFADVCAVIAAKRDQRAGQRRTQNLGAEQSKARRDVDEEGEASVSNDVSSERDSRRGDQTSKTRDRDRAARNVKRRGAPADVASKEPPATIRDVRSAPASDDRGPPIAGLAAVTLGVAVATGAAIVRRRVGR